MNALLNSGPRKAVRDFREQHGLMESWSGDDFERFYDVLVIANRPGPAARLRLRLALLVWTGTAMPFYACGELLWAAQHKVSQRLDTFLDRLDDRCSTSESACKQIGDHVLVERVGSVSEWISAKATAVGRAAARLAKG
ncbi:hypothetical protein [Streptacidiphilus carbonis]|uniref:hypothetical protein n=1 Tax=Streptacidiphilus carbonis TaxID=105422 RepID=UPI0005A97E42|nr:hypothetical protein [Streptacidiphilus carbonis]